MLNESRAFPGVIGTEIQFFRARLSDTAQTFGPREMLHHPLKLRGKTGNFRFSIPGVTSLYLANSSYGCWIEMGCPSEHDFNVSPFVLDGSQRIFNLAVMTRYIYRFKNEDIHCWIKLLILMIATSYKISENNRVFKSEYIISQSVMLACKRLGFDGVAYFSKRVESELFAFNAVNLALFAEYKKGQEYAEICNHMKVDESLNYQLFRQLTPVAKNKRYEHLRLENTGLITNIGNFKHQYDYRDTEFFSFDEHLFARWEDKDTINWGNALGE